MTIYIRPAQVTTRQNTNIEKGKWTQNPLGCQEVICNILTGKGKSVFSNGESLGRVGGRERIWSRYIVWKKLNCKIKKSPMNDNLIPQ